MSQSRARVNQIRLAAVYRRRSPAVAGRKVSLLNLHTTQNDCRRRQQAPAVLERRAIDGKCEHRVACFGSERQVEAEGADFKKKNEQMARSTGPHDGGVCWRAMKRKKEKKREKDDIQESDRKS